MITSGGGFGQVIPMSHRMPFRRPANAGFYKPHLAPTAFYSHINPFVHTMLPIAAFRPGLPRMPRLLRPGVVTGRGGPNTNLPPPGPRPDVVPMPQQIKGFGATGFKPRFTSAGPPPFYGGFGAEEAPAMMPAPTPPTPTIPAVMRRPHRASPYGPQNPYPARTGRTGVWPHVMSTAGGIRQGASGAAAAINRMRWGTYSNRAEIEGTVDPNRAY